MKGDWPRLDRIHRHALNAIVENLQQLANFGPRWDQDRRYGICYHLAVAAKYQGCTSQQLKLLHDELLDQFKSWPKYSGHDLFPVPITKDEVPPHIYSQPPASKFQFLANRRLLWAENQGMLRRELSYFLLENFSDHVKYTLSRTP